MTTKQDINNDGTPIRQPIIWGTITPAGVEFICPVCNFVTAVVPPEDCYDGMIHNTHCSHNGCNREVRIRLKVEKGSSSQDTRHQIEQNKISPKNCESAAKLEDHPEIVFVRISDIIVPDELIKPIGVSSKVILKQWHEGTCEPIVITPEKVLVEGIKQSKSGAKTWLDKNSRNNSE